MSTSDGRVKEKDSSPVLAVAKLFRLLRSVSPPVLPLPALPPVALLNATLDVRVLTLLTSRAALLQWPPLSLVASSTGSGARSEQPLESGRDRGLELGAAYVAETGK
ncbi:hypothetical protein NDU88_006520 [Pleurodeles waltl]|uniref:Uncharacterized protein n=1 Tax=Pleurodeles waltl TaxID=8319 RepID=A0AAV7NTC0_PLEWA|nr:hypothetical protein NDU88_006520 [Pleurodeles waltl]